MLGSRSLFKMHVQTKLLNPGMEHSREPMQLKRFSNLLYNIVFLTARRLVKFSVDGLKADTFEARLYGDT